MDIEPNPSFPSIKLRAISWSWSVRSAAHPFSSIFSNSRPPTRYLIPFCLAFFYFFLSTWFFVLIFSSYYPCSSARPPPPLHFSSGVCIRSFITPFFQSLPVRHLLFLVFFLIFLLGFLFSHKLRKRRVMANTSRGFEPRYETKIFNTKLLIKP